MSEAKLHHFVPRFLLRRFTTAPNHENPRIWRLDKKTGRTAATGIKNEAGVSYFNRLETPTGIPADAVEQVLGMVESLAAGTIDKLVAGLPLEEGEREGMGLFIYLQHQRTPRGRHWMMSEFEQALTLSALQRVLDPALMQNFYRSQGEEVSLEEARRRGAELASQLEKGDLILKGQHDHAVANMLLHANDLGLTIAHEMTWGVLHSQGQDRFIISDHPVLIHDPQAGPERGAGWLSSPDVEVSLPLDSGAALLLAPGEPSTLHEQAGPEDVEEINLRTYAEPMPRPSGRSMARIKGPFRL
jgi:Protein of unknown function (DUF4238)